MLCSIEIPSHYAPGLNLNSPERALPQRTAQLESLRDVLRERPGVTMREAKHLRNGLARDAPATFSP